MDLNVLPSNVGGGDDVDDGWVGGDEDGDGDAGDDVGGGADADTLTTG